MNQPGYGIRRPADNSVIPNVIFTLLIANGLVFVLQHFQWEFLLRNFALWPLNTPPDWPSFMPWQLVSYAFLHDPNGLAHIFFNMFGLWMFGRDLERLMGPQRFLVYYMTCVIGAGIIQLIVVEIQGGVYPTLGASGGLFGIQGELDLLGGHRPFTAAGPGAEARAAQMPRSVEITAAGACIETHPVDMGEAVYRAGHSSGIDPEAWGILRSARTLLKAPVTTPQGGGVKSVNVTLRKSLGLYANVRPCVAYDPFIPVRHPHLDVVIVRENEEDLYAGIEHQQTSEVVQSLKLITRPGSERIISFS